MDAANGFPSDHDYAQREYDHSCSEEISNFAEGKRHGIATSEIVVRLQMVHPIELLHGQGTAQTSQRVDEFNRRYVDRACLEQTIGNMFERFYLFFFQ